MELITYRKTLDVYKNGIQFMLQGFETADNMSRVIEISLMASGDAIDFPLERIMALMYVTTPSATEPSINECTIKDNKVVYNVLPIVEEGITTMQLKLIETSPEGAKRVLASPKFAVEVNESVAKDESVKQSTTFTALEDAVAKAKAVYDARFLRLALDSDCIFKAYYADGTTYETDLLKKMFHEGNSLLAQSFARGDTGIRDGEDMDNAKYYSNVSKSESLNAKNTVEYNEKLLEEARLHGVYTAFDVSFETGELVYISPKYKFTLNIETGELDANGILFSPEDVLLTCVIDWLTSIGISLPDDFNVLKKKVDDNSEDLSVHGEELLLHREELKRLDGEVRPIEKGGTGAITAEKALENLGGASMEYVNDVLSSLYPFAVPMAWLSNKLPDDSCVFLEGQAISRTDYADLFSLWGTTFGEGDGNTTFNVPNLSGRTLVGVDTSVTEFNTIGKTGGEYEHTLTVDEMPSHSHSVSTMVHSAWATSSGSGGQESFASSAISTGVTGGGQAHNNMQPYFVIRYMCKAKLG